MLNLIQKINKEII